MTQDILAIIILGLIAAVIVLMVFNWTYRKIIENQETKITKQSIQILELTEQKEKIYRQAYAAGLEDAKSPEEITPESVSPFEYPTNLPMHEAHENFNKVWGESFIPVWGKVTLCELEKLSKHAAIIDSLVETKVIKHA